MGTTKDLIYNIESKRDISCVKLSYRIYNRLSKANKEEYHRLFKEQPEYGPKPTSDDRVVPLRQYIANMALWVYAKSTKKWKLRKCFRYARKNLEVLYTQFNTLDRELRLFSVSPHRYHHLANQFIFHGFVSLAEAPDIEEGEGNSYITSTLAIDGVTYIYPHKLYMSTRPGKNHDKKHLWYQFESGLGIPGHTRVWYPTELKSLKRNQNAQRNSR